MEFIVFNGSADGTKYPFKNVGNRHNTGGVWLVDFPVFIYQSGLLHVPDGGRFNVVRGACAAVFAGGSGKPADDFDVHIMVALNLTAQADIWGIGQPLDRQDFFFRSGDGGRFTRYEFHPTCGTSGKSATGVKLVNMCFILQGIDQPLAGGHFKCSKVIHNQLGHVKLHIKINRTEVCRWIATDASGLGLALASNPRDRLDFGSRGRRVQLNGRTLTGKKRRKLVSTVAQC